MGEQPPSPSGSPDEPGSAGVELAPGVRAPQHAVQLAFVRSSGPGGQNVNKRATKAQLRVRLDEIPLAPPVRARLERLAAPWITTAGEIVIASDEFRSQRRNREACFQRLRRLIIEARRRPTPRKPTRPTRGAIERRLQDKRERSERKRRRRPPDAQ